MYYVVRSTVTQILFRADHVVHAGKTNQSHNLCVALISDVALGKLLYSGLPVLHEGARRRRPKNPEGFLRGPLSP